MLSVCLLIEFLKTFVPFLLFDLCAAAAFGQGGFKIKMEFFGCFLLTATPI